MIFVMLKLENNHNFQFKINLSVFNLRFGLKLKLMFKLVLHCAYTNR